MRGLDVTGLLTSALPIYAPSPPPSPPPHSPASDSSALGPPECPPPSASRSAQSPSRPSPTEIGRASCRETLSLSPDTSPSLEEALLPSNDQATSERQTTR